MDEYLLNMKDRKNQYNIKDIIDRVYSIYMCSHLIKETREFTNLFIELYLGDLIIYYSEADNRINDIVNDIKQTVANNDFTRNNAREILNRTILEKYKGWEVSIQ